MSSIAERDKIALATKLPPKGEYVKKKRKMPKLPKPPSGPSYTRLSRTELKILIGSKPRFPVYLDFTDDTFKLESDDFLGTCPNVIKELDLTNNSLTECSSFEYLTKLKRVILDNNSLREVNFAGLSSVVVLSIEKNRLEYLPDMSALKKCVNLNLSGNCLTAGFPQLAKLKSLQVLDLGRNGIEFPLGQFYTLLLKNLVGLPKLKFLSFADNPCESAIKNFRLFIISELPKLVYLDWKKITAAERAQAALLAKQGAWSGKTYRGSPSERMSNILEIAEKPRESTSKTSTPVPSEVKSTSSSKQKESKVFVEHIEDPLAPFPASDSLEDLLREAGGGGEDIDDSNAHLDALLDSLKMYEGEGGLDDQDLSAGMLDLDDLAGDDANYLSVLQDVLLNDGDDVGDDDTDYLSKLYKMVSGNEDGESEEGAEAELSGIGPGSEEKVSEDLFDPPLPSQEADKEVEESAEAVLDSILDGTELPPYDLVGTDTPGDEIFDLLDEIMADKLHLESEPQDDPSHDDQVKDDTQLHPFSSSSSSSPSPGGEREQKKEEKDTADSSIYSLDFGELEDTISALEHLETPAVSSPGVASLMGPEDQSIDDALHALEQATTITSGDSLPTLTTPDTESTSQANEEILHSEDSSSSSSEDSIEDESVSLEASLMELEQLQTDTELDPPVEKPSKVLPKGAVSTPLVGVEERTYSRRDTPLKSTGKKTDSGRLMPAKERRTEPPFTSSSEPEVVDREVHQPTSVEQEWKAPSSSEYSPTDAIAALEMELADVTVPEMRPWEVKYSELYVGKRLGLGKFGNSFKGILRERPVVVKKLHCQSFSDSFLENLREEAPMLCSLQHDNVAEFIALCTDTELCAISEYVDGTPLWGYLRNPAHIINVDWILRVAVQIARAVHYLHSNGVLHRHLKTKNIFIDRDQNVKINDYGMDLIKDEVQETGQIGDAEYMSPEVLMKEPPAPHSDVYSFGMILWEMFTRTTPYRGIPMRDIKNVVVYNNQRPGTPSAPYVFTRLIQSCWNHDPTKRPSFAVILKILSQSKEQLLKYDGDDMWINETIPVNAFTGHTDGSTAPSSNNDISGNGGVSGGSSIGGSGGSSRLAQADQKTQQVVTRILEMLRGGDMMSKTRAIKALLNFVRDDNNRLLILETDILGELLSAFTPDSADMTNEQVARVLTALADGDECISILGETDIILRILDLIEESSNNVVVTQSVQLLARLSSNEENKIKVMEAKGIATLVALLSSSSDMTKLQAASALALLLELEGNQEAFYEASGVHPLLKLLSSTNPGIQLRVLEVLSCLATNEKMELIIRKVGVLRRFTHLLEAKSPLLLLQSIKSVSKFAENKVLRIEMHNNGVMECLLRLLSSQDQQVLFWTSKSLALFAKDEKFVMDMSGKGGICGVVKALVCPYDDAKLELARFLHRVLFSEQNKRHFVENGGITSLVSVMSSQTTSNETIEHALGALLQVASDQRYSGAIGRSGAIGVVVEHMGLAESEGIVGTGLATLSKLAPTKENKDILQDADAICHFVTFLDHEKREWRELATLGLASLADNEGCRKCIIDEGGLYPLLIALNESNPVIQERVLWGISFFALSVENHQEIINTSVDVVVQLLASTKPAVQSLALKTIILLLARRSEENQAAIRAAGGESMLREATTSHNRTVSLAAQKALTFL